MAASPFDEKKTRTRCMAASPSCPSPGKRHTRFDRNSITRLSTRLRRPRSKRASGLLWYTPSVEPVFDDFPPLFMFHPSNIPTTKPSRKEKSQAETLANKHYVLVCFGGPGVISCGAIYVLPSTLIIDCKIKLPSMNSSPVPGILVTSPGKCRPTYQRNFGKCTIFSWRAGAKLIVPSCTNTAVNSAAGFII